MYTRNFTYIFVGLIFLGLFAHLPDIGGDTPTRLLFGWAIVFAVIGYAGIPALMKDDLLLSPAMLVALFVTPAFYLLLGASGQALDWSFAWTPAIVIFSVALLFICLANLGLDESAYDKIVIFAVLTQALLLLGSADYPFLALIPGPVAWPSQQVFVHGGYWQVNVMSNILSCLSLWSLWHISRNGLCNGFHIAVSLAAFILFPMVVGWSNSLSGGVFLVFGLSIMALAAWQQKDDIRGNYFLTGLGVIIISLLSASFFAVGADITPNIVAKAGASSAPDRIGIWLRSYYAFREAPLFGHGIGFFAEIYNDVSLRYENTQNFRWIDNTRHAHNIVMHNLVEIGLLGTFILLTPFVWLGVSLLRHNSQHWVTVAIVCPILGHMLTGYPQRQSALPLLLIVLIVSHMSLIYGSERRFRLSLRKIRLSVRMAGLAVFVLPGIAFSIWTAIAYHQASGKHMALTSLEYSPRMIPWRFSQADLHHPFLSYHANVQAVFVLTSRALVAQDGANLPKLLEMLSVFERTHVRGRATWSNLVRGYIFIGDLDKARDIMLIGAALAPEWAERTMASLPNEMSGNPELARSILNAIDPNLRPAE